MPELFSLGQHPAFEAETICAFFFVALIEWCLFSICSNVSFGFTPASTSIWGKHKSGTEVDSSLPVAIC